MDWDDNREEWENDAPDLDERDRYERRPYRGGRRGGQRTSARTRGRFSRGDYSRYDEGARYGRPGGRPEPFEYDRPTPIYRGRRPEDVYERREDDYDMRSDMYRVYGPDYERGYGPGNSPYRRRDGSDADVDWLEHEPDFARRRQRRGPHAGLGPAGYQRSDERIVEDVSENLTENTHVDASNIQVSSENGEVTLDGTVDSRRAKRMAEELAEYVRGVHDVHNRLRIERSTIRRKNRR